MATLEAGLRGGAMALLVLLALSGLRAARRSFVSLAGVLIDLCAICFLVETTPELASVTAWWIVPLRLASNLTPAMFLIWTTAVFEDVLVPPWWLSLPVALMAVLASAAMAINTQAAWMVVHAVAILLVAAGVALELAGLRADLVERRRRLRLAFAIGIGVVIVASTTLGAMGIAASPAVAAVFGIALAAALLRLRVERQTELLVQPVPALVPLPSVEDHGLAARLASVMETERAHRDGALTVAALAERLGVPEYRLRRLINQQLGHRNFSTFVNGYRLGEARAALADPTQARVPVLTIALDAGFASIGPFNRAFKGETGETPTEYRRRHLADSGIGAVPRQSASPAARPAGE